MFRILKTLMFGLVIGAILSCGGGKLSENLPADRQAEYDWLKETKPVLDQKRIDLKDLAAQVKSFVAPVTEEVPAEEGATPAPTLEELNANLAGLKKEVSQLEKDFQGKLEGFLYELDKELLKAHQKSPNINPRKESLEITGFMSEENMLVSQAWVKKQGDYKKAIENMEIALESDPNNTMVLEYLAKLKVDQYMTEEKLAMVNRGMTEEEVAITIGMVYRNFKETWQGKDKQPDTMAWFYPREDGGVAGVIFLKGSDGSYTVGKTNYNAKKSKADKQAEKEAEAAEKAAE